MTHGLPELEIVGSGESTTMNSVSKIQSENENRLLGEIRELFSSAKSGCKEDLSNMLLLTTCKSTGFGPVLEVLRYHAA